MKHHIPNLNIPIFLTKQSHSSLCECNVCVQAWRSLQGGVFLLFPYLLFRTSCNIYLRFASPVPVADCQCVLCSQRLVPLLLSLVKQGQTLLIWSKWLRIVILFNHFVIFLTNGYALHSLWLLKKLRSKLKLTLADPALALLSFALISASCLGDLKKWYIIARNYGGSISCLSNLQT